MVYNVTKVLYSSKNPEEKQTNKQTNNYFWRIMLHRNLALTSQE